MNFVIPVKNELESENLSLVPLLKFLITHTMLMTTIGLKEFEILAHDFSSALLKLLVHVCNKKKRSSRKTFINRAPYCVP